MMYIFFILLTQVWNYKRKGSQICHKVELTFNNIQITDRFPYIALTSKPHIIDHREDMERILTVQTDHEISFSCINLHIYTDGLALTEWQKQRPRRAASVAVLCWYCIFIFADESWYDLRFCTSTLIKCTVHKYTATNCWW